MNKTTKYEFLAVIFGLVIIALLGVIIYHFTKKQENFEVKPKPGQKLTCQELQKAFNGQYNTIAENVKNKLQPLINQEYQKEMNAFTKDADVMKYLNMCKSLKCAEDCGQNTEPSKAFSALQFLSENN